MRATKLQVSGGSIALPFRCHITDGVKDPKPLFPILCGILATEIEWADGFGETFRKNHASLSGLRKLIAA